MNIMVVVMGYEYYYYCSLGYSTILQYKAGIYTQACQIHNYFLHDMKNEANNKYLFENTEFQFSKTKESLNTSLVYSGPDFIINFMY